jgi:hypothetical protein
MGVESTVVGTNSVATHADQEVEDVECGTKMHRWSVAESWLGSDCQLTVLRFMWRLVLHTEVLKTFRVVCSSLKMCSIRPATGPYLEPNERRFPSPQIQWYVYHVVPSPTVFVTEILYVYLIAFFTFMWPCIVTNFFIIKPTRCTNFTNLFWPETLRVSDSSSVHNQEFIHCTLSSGICHTLL